MLWDYILNVLDKEEIKNVCDAFQPTVIINTAAMTNVDACEDNKQGCIDLNVKAVKYLFDYFLTTYCLET